MNMATYNSLRVGVTINDPTYLFTLEGHEDHPELPLGAFDCAAGAAELIGYLAMRAFGVTLAEQREWVQKNSPVLVVINTETGERLRFNYDGERLPPA
jgi:hypothetical protein